MFGSAFKIPSSLFFCSLWFRGALDAALMIQESYSSLRGAALTYSSLSKILTLSLIASTSASKLLLPCLFLLEDGIPNPRPRAALQPRTERRLGYQRFDGSLIPG
ncbi:hypothetical protein GOODEAATRI_000907 [Goodea atripinnis]|uniref:Secreted protein n=1 Tax=Goodea atripinnis TaxID=208336 RepID=A0ABV0MNA9_9TELE